MRPLLATALCVALPCLAAESPSLSISALVQTAQTGYGSASRLKALVSARYPLSFGALYWQDGEGGVALPAPAGKISLGVANEPLWSLGAGVGQNLAVARYTLDLPQHGALSLGWADRIGPHHPGRLIVANLDAPIAELGRHGLSLQGWASLADGTRRRALGHADNGAAWQLEQGNLVLMVTHPLRGHWSLNAGIGSRWLAEDGARHSAGWQTLLGVSWDMERTAPPRIGH